MKTVRLSLIFFGLVSAFLAFNSCGKTAQTGTQGDTLDRIRQTGQIETCTVVYPPYAMKDPKSGKLSGECVDMMEMIAQKMNAKVNWHETTFGNAAADLASGRCDIMAQGFNSNIPRAMAVAFTLPAIWFAGESGVVRKNDNRFMNVKSIEDFDKTDLTVVVPTGEAGDVFVTENFKHAKIKRIDVESSDISRFCVEVSAGRADIAIADQNTIALFAKHHPEVLDLFHDRPFSLNPASWAVRQDDLKWLHFVETALQFLDTQGTLVQLDHKYKANLMHLVKKYKLQ